MSFIYVFYFIDYFTNHTCTFAYNHIIDSEDRCHSVGCMSPPISCPLGHYSLVNNDSWTIFTMTSFPPLWMLSTQGQYSLVTSVPLSELMLFLSGLLTQVIMNAECILCNEACKQQCKWNHLSPGWEEGQVPHYQRHPCSPLSLPCLLIN